MKISARSSKESCLGCCAEGCGVAPEVTCPASWKAEGVTSHLHPPQVRTHAKHVKISRAFDLLLIEFTRLAASPSAVSASQCSPAGSGYSPHESYTLVVNSLRFCHVILLLLRRKSFFGVSAFEDGNNFAQWPAFLL